MKKQEATFQQLSKEHNEALLDLHLTGEPITGAMAIHLVKLKLLDKVGDITKEGVKAVHAYAAEKNKLNWKDK